MNRRIETFVGLPEGLGTDYIINREATEVYWLSICPNIFLTPAVIHIYDGFDANGKLKWTARPGQSRHYNFIPPIHCEQAVYVGCSDEVGSFTIGYRPKKWDRPKPMEKDVIEHPKA